MKKKYGFISKENPWHFFIITFTLTWIFWISAILLKKNFHNSIVFLLILAGGIFGKLIPAIVLPYLNFSKNEWKDFLIRIIDVKRIKPEGWFYCIFLPPIFAILSIIAVYLIKGFLPSFEILLNFLKNPLKLFSFMIFIFLYGPLPEEMGWNGYELDIMQKKYSALVSSLIIGFFWGLWHLPLFFINGTYQHDVIGFNSSLFWLTFLPGVITLQILQTWLYNNNLRSTLTTVLIHFMVNLTGELLKLNPIHEYFRTLFSVIFVLIILIRYDSGTFLRKNSIYLKNKSFNIPNYKRVNFFKLINFE